MELLTVVSRKTRETQKARHVECPEERNRHIINVGPVVIACQIGHLNKRWG